MRATAYDRILDALEAVGARTYNHADRVRAQCPGHSSRGLSLIVSRRDGSAGVHCFAGCETIDVMAALGLTMRDLFDGDLPPGYVPPPRRDPGPWGIVTNGPGIEHLLRRIVQHHRDEADPSLRQAANAEHARVVVIR